MSMNEMGEGEGGYLRRPANPNEAMPDSGREKREIPLSMAALANAVRVLHQAIEDLGARMTSVLRPETTGPRADSEKTAAPPMAADTPLARGLNDVVAEVSLGAERILRITNSMEL